MISEMVLKETIPKRLSVIMLYRVVGFTIPAVFAKA